MIREYLDAFDMAYSETERLVDGARVWGDLRMEHMFDGWFHLRGGNLRLTLHFAPPVRLSDINVECLPDDGLSAVVVPLNVRLFSVNGGPDNAQHEILYTKPIAQGAASVQVERKDRLLWDRVIFQFASLPGPIRLKPAFYITTAVGMPSWDVCVATHGDFVLRCADKVDVCISSAVLMASCEFFGGSRSAFKDAHCRSLDLTGAYGFHSSVALAVKQILETREMDETVLTADGFGAEVVRLLYYFLVIGRERVWRVFEAMLPSLAAEQFKVVVDLVCDYGDMHTLRVFGGLAVDEEALVYVAHKMKENIHRFFVEDPFPFVHSLRAIPP